MLEFRSNMAQTFEGMAQQLSQNAIGVVVIIAIWILIGAFWALWHIIKALYQAHTRYGDDITLRAADRHLRNTALPTIILTVAGLVALRFSEQVGSGVLILAAACGFFMLVALGWLIFVSFSTCDERRGTYPRKTPLLTRVIVDW
jgi:hypothetical protein